MNSFSIWIEISIAGFFYAIALFFFILTILGVKDLRFVLDFKDYLALVAAGITIISYILGIFAHRLLPPLIKQPIRFIKKVFRKKKTEVINKDSISSKVNSVNIWQYGSVRLHKEIDFQFSLKSMFFSLILGSPLAGLCAAIWFWGTSNQKIGTIVILLGFFFGLLSFFAYKIQNKAYEKFLEAAFEEMKKVKNIVREK